MNADFSTWDFLKVRVALIILVVFLEHTGVLYNNQKANIDWRDH